MERNTNVGFKCPYNEHSCMYVNTCGMSVDKSCQECDHYHNGVRATGGMPGLELIVNKIKRIWQHLKH